MQSLVTLMYNKASMKLVKGLGEFFALDIGTQAIRLVQLVHQGVHCRLSHVGYAAVDARTLAAGTPAQQKKLTAAIATVVAQAGVTARNVVIGLSSAKTFTTVIEMPTMGADELAGTLRYQAEQYLPMPLDDTQYDYVVLGPAPGGEDKQLVLITSTAKEYADMMVRVVDAAGLNVIAAEPNPIAMVRALLPRDASGAHIMVMIGESATDIVVTVGEKPVLVRSLPGGLQAMEAALVQHLAVQPAQARQFIVKFGLAQDRLEGQVVRTLQGALDNLTSEISKSARFYQTNYPGAAVQTVRLSGYGGVIPLLPEYIAARLSVTTEVTNPWHAITIPQDLSTKVLPVEFEFATAVGLALRKGGV